MERRLVADKDQETVVRAELRAIFGLCSFPADLQPALARARMVIAQPPVPDPPFRGGKDLGEDFLPLRPEQAPKVPTAVLKGATKEPGEIAGGSQDMAL
ncbi:MAG: hypothetical protein WCQ50_13525 [Spirochaetota bacterium]